MPRFDELFSGEELSKYLQGKVDSLCGQVAAIPQDQFMNADPSQVVEHVLTSFNVTSIVIDEDHKTMDSADTSIDVTNWMERKPVSGSRPHSRARHRSNGDDTVHWR